MAGEPTWRGEAAQEPPARSSAGESGNGGGVVWLWGVPPAEPPLVEVAATIGSIISFALGYLFRDCGGYAVSPVRWVLAPDGRF